ncbi:hypothetical protein SAY86_025543 [Trapa natans]|uniref:G-patch domain-containing protein n=1 Tax=Trapa natans TaxID=22666 RepID=A0AAN7RKV2_TRANT|nr:hypothetical protein SAY86_025543 [Trapa natans]
MAEEPPNPAEDSHGSLPGQQDCSFVWDEASQLYYHAGSRDGVYYKFEDGKYVPLEFNKPDESDAHHYKGSSSKHTDEDESCYHEGADGCENTLVIDDGYEGYRQDGITPGASDSDRKYAESILPENLPPPSAWLEDTLIELYLSNYPKPGYDASDDTTEYAEACNGTNVNLSLNEENEVYELEEGEWIPEDDFDPSNSIEGVSEEEENWRAQYGQVTQSQNERVLDFLVIDLWDWKMVREAGKNGKSQVSRLIGRLVKQNVKLHPSVPSGGSLFKTAQIYQVSFDLVRVRTGQVYRLRNPSRRYLASLPSYDSSNPTRDWGFPELSIDAPPLTYLKSRKNTKLKVTDGAGSSRKLPVTPDEPLASDKHRALRYRDRAAERRTLHGGFGFGPGQKNFLCHADGEQSFASIALTEEAAGESMNMLTGANSYGRRVLESMGWKEVPTLSSLNHYT